MSSSDDGSSGGGRTGRSPSDAVVELTRLANTLFGPAFPYIVIAGLAIYGFVQLQSVYQQAERQREEVWKQASEQYQSALAGSLEAIRNTYTTIADLNDKQLKAISDNLTIQERLGEKLKALESETEQGAQELADIRLKLDNARQETQAEVERTQEIQARLDTASTELEARTKDLRRREEDLAKRAGNIAELRDRLRELADALKEDAAPNSDNYRLALDVRAQYFIEPDKLFASYAKDPGRTTVAGLQDLIGVSEEKFLDLLTLHDGLSLPFWLKLIADEKEYAYISVAQAASGGYRGPMAIEVGDGRIARIDTLQEIFAIKLPDHRDWTRRIAYYAVAAEDGLEDSSIRIVPPEQQTWQLVDSVKSLDNAFRIEQVYGTDPGVPFLDAAGFEERLRRTTDGRDVLDEIHRPPMLNIAMERRARDFDNAVLAKAELSRLPEELRQPFAELLGGAVAGRRSQAVLPAPSLPADALGRIAATVLRPGFGVVDAKPLEDVRMQQQAAPAAEGEPAGYTILVGYRSGEAPDDLEHATFTLTRREEARGWLLADFAPYGAVKSRR